jgi:hypothetical protein
MSIDRDGFLSPDIAQTRDGYGAQHPDDFQMIIEINRVAQLALPSFATLQRTTNVRTSFTVDDAAQLHNILPADVRPTVVVMNPPFSRPPSGWGVAWCWTRAPSISSKRWPGWSLAAG